MDALSPALRAAVTLFSQRLGHVQFPGVGAAQLSALAAEVEAAREAVLAAEAGLASARAAQAAAEGALAQRVERGLAYARIYAEDDAELSAELAAIALPRLRRAGPAEPPPTPAPGARRRGRPPRPSAEAAQLHVVGTEG